MIRADVITLLSETAHGVFESNTPTETTVFAEIQSVRQKEFYLALNDGIQPEYVFVLTDYADYNDQKLIRWNGLLWDVVRTYTPVNGQTIELTVKKHEVNA
jgi:SPP1 family predicted phage head-tail adaptor